MQFFCFSPKPASLWLQHRHRSNNHAKEMLRLPRLFSTGSDVFKKFLLRHGIIRFDVIRSHTRSGTDQLADYSTGDRALGNCFREIDNCFSKSCRSFLKIVNTFLIRLFTNNRRFIVPKRITATRPLNFGLRHYFVIRHSCFVILFLIRQRKRLRSALHS
jgi:hypothetical protein